MERGDPLVQGAAVARDHRALELCRRRQGFLRRLRLYEPGTAAGRVGRHAGSAAVACGARRCVDEMENYNHQVGLKIVGEVLPQERNRVTLAEEKRPIRAADRPRHLFLVRQRQAADRARARLHAQALEAPARATSGSRTTTPAISTAPRAWATIRADSVVDADCRCWDIPNLWICDGSVFPDRRRRQSVADHPGDRLPHRRPDQGPGARGEL